jgi:hypothetical protein
MNFKKSIVPFLLVLIAVVAVFLFVKTRSLQNQLAQTQKKQNLLSQELSDYEKLVQIDSLLLKGEYDTALNSYHQTLNVQNENKMRIPLRIALAQKLFQVEQANKIAKKNRIEESDTPVAAKINTPKDIRKQDSLSFTLEKTKVQLAHLRRQLQKKAFGEYIQFKSQKGNKMHYVGEVKKGKANGFGIALLDSGSRYEGEWKNNQRHGEGTFYWADGQYYVGTYNSDKRSGYGSYFWPNGEKYEGEWEDDKRSGSGKFFGTDGAIVTTGQWEDDKLVNADK